MDSEQGDFVKTLRAQLQQKREYEQELRERIAVLEGYETERDELLDRITELETERNNTLAKVTLLDDLLSASVAQRDAKCPANGAYEQHVRAIEAENAELTRTLIDEREAALRAVQGVIDKRDDAKRDDAKHIAALEAERDKLQNAFATLAASSKQIVIERDAARAEVERLGDLLNRTLTGFNQRGAEIVRLRKLLNLADYDAEPTGPFPALVDVPLPRTVGVPVDGGGDTYR